MYLQYKSTRTVVFNGEVKSVLSATQVYIEDWCARVAFLTTKVNVLVAPEGWRSPAPNVASTKSPWSHWTLGMGLPVNEA